MEIIKNFIKYILLGIVQGLTEVLPISSSGHVTIAQTLLGVDTDGGILFLILINIGSLVAVLIHFRKMILRLIRNFFLFIFQPLTRDVTREDYLYCWKIVLASIPIGITGFLLNDTINEILNRYPLVVVGIGLLGTGTLLYLVRNASYVNGRQTITFRDALTIGIGQSFSPLPGFSRSGVTTTTGLMQKLSMETALVFSFMLYIPVSLGSTFKYLLEFLISPSSFNWGFDPSFGWSYLFYIVATFASFLATVFSLKFIFVWFRRGKLVFFSFYTLALGLLCMLAGLAAL